jgi:predicted ferric reductase
MTCFKRHIYEIFLKSHFALALFVMYALWRHLSIRKAFARVYIVAAAGALLSSTAFHGLFVLARNIAYKKPLSRAHLEHRNNAVKVVLTVPRPFKVRAGQYVYVWIPGISFWSIFQSHPFAITWWEENESGDAVTLSLLVQSRGGFTDKLLRYTTSNNEFVAWIDGPYGANTDLGRYGTVLLFATGIGIAAQISCIRELMQGYKECRVITRKIVLAWETDEESERARMSLR